MAGGYRDLLIFSFDTKRVTCNCETTVNRPGRLCVSEETKKQWKQAQDVLVRDVLVLIVERDG